VDQPVGQLKQVVF